MTQNDIRDTPIQNSLSEKIGDNELVSIAAMIAYAAHQTKFSEAVLVRQLINRLALNDLKEIKLKDFEGAIKFIADFLPDSDASCH